MPDGGASNGNNFGREAVLDRLLKTADDACALGNRAAGIAAVSAVFDAVESGDTAIDVAYAKRNGN
ncbi:MAG TPA: hypothetical protein VIJ46_04700 [Rhabdochlamydiaceae bacterium]